MQAWSMMAAIPLLAVEAPAAGVVGVTARGLISGGANFNYQLSTGKPVNYVDLSVAAGVGMATQGRGFGVTMGTNLSGSYLGSVIKGEDATYSLLGTAVGGALGYGSGQLITGQLKPYIGASAETIGNMAGSLMSEHVGGKIGSIGEKK